ncbi:MAG: hypothetical protein V1837_00930 [Candidatus Woesearchaeota archaeon]
MDLMIKTYLERAENELALALLLLRISQEEEIKAYLCIDEQLTFFSSVISHSYYAIFYSTKALLLTKQITTSSPDIHKKTFDCFKNEFVDTGILDVRLLQIYQKLVIRADELLEIFKDEKWKRGNFTYNTIPQANQEPAKDSAGNAKTFVSNIIKVIGKSNKSKDTGKKEQGLT